jgi:hypothetical protein
MSALRAHSSEITEGIGSTRVLSREAASVHSNPDVSAPPVAHLDTHLDTQGARRAGTEIDGADAASADAPHIAAQCIELDSILQNGSELDSADRDSADPHSAIPNSVSGVAERGAASARNAAPRRSAEHARSGEQSRPSNTRAQSFHRYLSAQSDIDEEVIRLYKLVCRV